MGKQASFYAVQAGNKPGVYTTWAQCQQQTKGFAGAKYQKFTSKAEAEAFVKSGKGLGNAKDVAIKKVKKNSQAVKAVSKRKPKTPEPIEEEPCELEEQSQEDIENEEMEDVEDEPSELEEQSQEDIENEEMEDVEDEPSELEEQSQEDIENEEMEDVEDEPSELEEQSQDDIENEEEVEDIENEEEDMEDHSEDDLAPIEPSTDASEEGSVEIIYVSGASRGRGRKVSAGLGVYFGKDACNISARLPGSKQNIKRAELMAGIRALEKAPAGKAIEIHTTSDYLVQAITKVIPKLEQVGWLTAKGTEVENRDLFETLDTLVKQREPKPQWVHIGDKAGDSGIEKASELAIAGTNLEVSE